MTRSARRRTPIHYTPLQRATLPHRQGQEPSAPVSPGLVPWGSEEPLEAMPAHVWGRMNAPRVRGRRLASYTSKRLREAIRETPENLTTEYLNGGEPDAGDLSALRWRELYRAELRLRVSVAADANNDDEPADATGVLDDVHGDWFPPPEVTTLSTAGHSLVLAARAPGAPRLFVA